MNIKACRNRCAVRKGLYLVDQPNKRNRRDCAQYRESKPEGDVATPLRITEAEEL
jgi:hypothetical protein